MKSIHQLAVGSLAVLVLSACSGGAAERRQSQEEFDYLNRANTYDWNSPDGIERQEYPTFKIPQGQFSGGVGADVDIRPPQQVFDLVTGARVEQKDTNVVFWFSREAQRDELWTQLQHAAKDKGIQLQSSSTRLDTEWVGWRFANEDSEIRAQYLIEKSKRNGRFGVTISLTDWQASQALNRQYQERYTAQFANTLTMQIDETKRKAAEQQALGRGEAIQFTMGTDRTGLPVVIARAPYAQLWPQLPVMLDEFGFDVTERNQTQGTIKAKFEGTNSDLWEEMAQEPVRLSLLDHTILVGDLGNRTSINLTDNKGKPVDEEVLNGLAQALAHISSRN